MKFTQSDIMSLSENTKAKCQTVQNNYKGKTFAQDFADGSLKKSKLRVCKNPKIEKSVEISELKSSECFVEGGSLYDGLMKILNKIN